MTFKAHDIKNVGYCNHPPSQPLICYSLQKWILSGSEDLYAIQAPPAPRPPSPFEFGPPPKIDFFDVSDDFEEKKIFWYKKFFLDLENFFEDTPLEVRIPH